MGSNLSNFPIVNFAGAMHNTYGDKHFPLKDLRHKIDLNCAKRINGKDSILAKIEITTPFLEPKICHYFDADLVNFVYVADVQIDLFDENGKRFNKIIPIYDENNHIKGHYAVELVSMSDNNRISIDDFDCVDNQGKPIINTLLEEVYLSKTWLESRIFHINELMEQTMLENQTLNAFTFGMGEIDFQAQIQNKDPSLPQTPLTTAPLKAKSMMHAVFIFSMKYPDCHILSVSQI